MNDRLIPERRDEPRHQAYDESGTPAVRDWRTAIYPYTGKHRAMQKGEVR